MLHDDFRRALEAIKLRTPIEEVVRERVPGLKKAGALWVACCPFHDERTPSFKVDSRRGTWRCYGACGIGGDVIAFLERIDGVPFVEAVEILAARTGVELPRRRAGPEKDPALDPLRRALDLAQRFYARELASAEGRAAQRYLSGRGLAAPTIEAFGLGYAPASGHALVAALRGEGIDLAVAERAGLVRRSDEGRPYDFFRGRLTIPIKDLSGGVVGFGARRLQDQDEAGPKYVNTAETELFHKGRLVYALDRALPEIRKRGHAVLVEGYTDVMAAHQCGLSNVVAVLGTATTEDHAALIRRTGARRVSLVFDGDEAGRKAARKGLHGLLPLEVEIDVVALSGGVDPCDVCVKDGARAFLAELELARPWFEHLAAGLEGLRGADLARETGAVLELIARLARPVHREARLLELAERLRMSPDSLRAEMAQRARVRASPAALAAGPLVASGSGSGSALPDPTLVRSFEWIVGALLADPALLPVARPFLARCPDPELTRIAQALSDLRDEDGAELDESAVLTRLADDPARLRVVGLAERARADEDFTPARILEEQIEALRRRDARRELLAAQADLSAREGELLATAGAHAAAQDPTALELVRRLASQRGGAH